MVAIWSTQHEGHALRLHVISDERQQLVDELPRVGGARVEPEDPLDEIKGARLLTNRLGAPVELDVCLLQLSHGGANLLFHRLRAPCGAPRLLLRARCLGLERYEAFRRNATFPARGCAS